MQKKLLIVALATLFIATSCVKQKFDDSGVNLDFNALLDINQGSGPDDLVELPVGTQFGLSLPRTDIGETMQTSTLSNLPYTVGEDGAISGSELRLFRGASYMLYAYAPYKANITKATITPTFYHGEHILWASPFAISDMQSTANSAELHFSSRVSSVTFAVEYGEDVSSAEQETYPLSGKQFQAKGFVESCTMNLIDGTVVNGTGQDAKITILNEPVFFIPTQTTINIAVTIPGISSGSVEHIESITETFVAGKDYRYTITIGATKVTITGTVKDWVDGESGDKDVK